MLQQPFLSKIDHRRNMHLGLSAILYMVPSALACMLYYITSDGSPHFLSALPRSDAYFYLYNAWFKAFIDAGGGVTQALIPTSLYVDYLVGYFHLFGFNKASAYTANSALLVLSALILSLCTRSLYGRRTAIWCSLIIALCGPLLFFTGTTMKTVFVVFTLSLFLLCFVYYFRTKNPLLLFPTCLLIVLCSIDRHNSIALLAPVTSLATFYALRISKIHWLSLAGSITLSFLAMATIVDWQTGEVEPEFNAPLGLNFYVGNNEQSTGGYTSVHGLSNDLYGHRMDIGPYTESKLKKELTKDEISAYWFQKSLEFIENQPKDYALLQLKKLVLLSSQYTYGSPEQFAAWRWDNPVLSIAIIDYSFLISLCIVACFAGGRKHSATAIVLLSCFSIYAVSVWLFFVTERYKLPLYVFLIPLAAFGIEAFLRLEKKGKVKAFCVFIAMFSLSLSGNRIMEHGYGWPANHESYRSELKKSAQRIAPTYEAMHRIAGDTADSKSYETLASRLRTSFYRPDAARILEQAIERYPTDPEILELAFRTATPSQKKELADQIAENLSHVREPSLAQKRLLNGIQTYYRRTELIQP